MSSSTSVRLMDDSSINVGSEFAGVELRASGVSQEVRVRGTARSILADVDARLAPGNLTALMGPSGAGKTTLLTILRSGRCSAGSMTINGGPYTHATRKLIVTVPQDDVLLAGLSPLEMLMYAAHMKLPRALGRPAKLARVKAVLVDLNLEGEDQRTRIGSVDARGLSGGQRKRVSIGLELITNPAVLLCDEPTSGLDAKMASDVVGILRALSLQQRRTVVATIHQPAFALFARFDWLLLLCKGRLAYSGAALDAAGHFGALGFPTPQHENPADYIMRLLQDAEEARGVDLVGVWASSAAALQQRLCQQQQQQQQQAVPRRAAAAAADGGTTGGMGGGLVDFCYVTAVLCHRTVYDSLKVRLLPIASDGFRWLPVASDGQVASDGFRWLPIPSDGQVASDGFRWLPIASGGFRWLPVASGGFRWSGGFGWPRMASDGFRWLPVASGGFRWLPMDSDCFPLLTIA